ncbi:MAG TPA: EAL domain-containing protein [Thermoanaerobaculia bacterium]|jgi:PAS domain S-box-containing protein|nr:EAL domain-containing protein [Thermoanaerobaculia bacterium]
MKREMRVLLIEDNPADARLVRESLAGGRAPRPEVETFSSLREGLERLDRGGIDVLLLDLLLPESQGFETFEAAFAAAGDVPVLVLTGLDDEDLAARAVRAGAQDYLPKDGLDGGVLLRSLRHAIERKEVERELARATEQLHFQADVLAHVRDSVIVTDLEGRVTYWNDGARELFGYSAAEILGQTAARLYPDHANGAGELSRDLAATLEGGSRRVSEWRGLRKDGTEVWVDVQITPMRDRRGAVTGFVGVSEDVTESLRAARAQERLTAILEAAADFIGIASPDGKVLYMNRAGRAMVGAGADEDLAGTSIALYSPEWATRQFLEECFPVAARDGVWSGRSAFLSREGREIPVSQIIVAHKGTDGTVEYFSTIARDLTEKLRHEEDLGALNETLKALVEASPLAIVALDAERRITLWSPAAERTFGWPAEEVMGKRLPIVPDDKTDEHLVLCESVLAGQRFTGMETRRRDRAGAPIDLRISAAPLRDARGQIRGVAEFLEDINDRKRAERAIRRLASMPEQSPDPLIELDLAGNALYVNQAARSRFPDLQALGSWHPVLGNLATLFPRFRHGERKSFSFEVSHEQRTYHQMVYYVAEGSLVRVFLHDITEQRRAEAILERESLQDRSAPGTPQRSAVLSLDQLRLESDLRQALERRDLCMHYQPILRLADGALTGFEALMRWPRPERGLVPPSEFIPLAEETGLILQLFYWSLSEVCQRLREWGSSGCAPVVHLNVSGRVLSDPSLAHRVRAALAEACLDGGRLVLEITESVLMADPGAAAETLKRIKALGVGLSIDDFGTGYSSLSYLQQFPVDTLKIDRSFVARIGGHGESWTILQTILTLARRLSVEVIAEGVETEAQLAQLSAMGCGFSQGFLFSCAVESEAARALLERPTWSGLFPRATPAQRSGRGNLKAVGGTGT